MALAEPSVLREESAAYAERCDGWVAPTACTQGCSMTCTNSNSNSHPRSFKLLLTAPVLLVCLL